MIPEEYKLTDGQIEGCYDDPVKPYPVDRAIADAAAKEALGEGMMTKPEHKKLRYHWGISAPNSLSHCTDDCPACAYNQAIKECRAWIEACGLEVAHWGSGGG